MSQAPRAVPPSVNGWNAEYLDAQYQQFLADPASVPADLRSFFQGFDLAMASADGRPPAAQPGAPASADAMRLQAGVTNLIDSYRGRGHLHAAIDPFGRARPAPEDLSLGYHRLSEADLDKPVDPDTLPLPKGSTLRQVIELLQRTYCGPVGAQFMHVSDDPEREWLTRRYERAGGRFELSRGERAHVLLQIIRAEQFELFLGKRYPGDKRFSLEGGESLIPCLDRIIAAASDTGVEEIVIGMPHRGRLNVLNNILGKTYEQIFTEFEDNWEDEFVDAGGDVKYHKGYSGIRELPGGKSVHLALSSNPSHLESVNAVVEGRCRAKQRLRNDTVERSRVIPLLMHGDAAVIAQGMVAEVLNLSQLEGYTTGGTIHVVVNNLVGFTTGAEDARSTEYCTDIAMMVECPVFHVNGEDPEAVVAVSQLVVEYRQKFKKDVFIDLVCFRRYGHNETDEASFTQPVLAALIARKTSVLTEYATRLKDEGVLTEQDLKALRDPLIKILEEAQAKAKARPHAPNIDPGSKRWDGFGGDFTFDPVQTGVPGEVLEEVCAALGRVPPGFHLNPKLTKLLAERAALVETGQISYADAESLAIGTLLLEGHGVRLSGQDSRRGTFSHRHAVLRDVQTEEPYTPLNNMRTVATCPGDAGRPGPDGRLTQGKLCVYDSPLSEVSVMGFDYGYSLADPNMLVMWEGQFGDFCNGAQVMIDQYLAAAEVKWERWSGLVLLLPHGYEGAGPEHSSARLERFLQLCANNNLQVVNPSTAAQAFHMFRRQLRRSFRKPLIVMTPKSMLRIPTSTVDELVNGRFHEMLDDPMFEARGADRKTVERVLICSGKLYHELARQRAESGRLDTAILRIEQLYPFHTDLMAELLARYPARKRCIWVQEEPRNAGAYLFVADVMRTEASLGIEPGYIGRSACASPAVASKNKHKEQQHRIIDEAIGEAIQPGVAKSGANGVAARAPAVPQKKTARR